MKIKTWLILFETPLGSNGYAIVGARKASEAQEILIGLGIAINDGYKIVSIRDFPIPCPNYCAVYQEGVTTIGSGRNGESAYLIAVRLGFKGILYVPVSTSITPKITWDVKAKETSNYVSALTALVYDRTNNRLLFKVDSSSAYVTGIYTRTYIYRAYHCSVSSATATTVGSSVTSFSV